MTKKYIIFFTTLGLLSIGLGCIYLFHLYGNTEREVGIWGILEITVGIIILVFSVFFIENKYTKIMLYGVLIVNISIQIIPTILWFTFHGYGISDGTPPSDFNAKWFYSLPHILVGLLSILGTILISRRDNNK